MKKIIVIAVLLFGFTIGCEDEIIVPFLSDSEEIERYVADADLGRIFFATDKIIIDTPYYYIFDSSAYYVDVFVSNDRDVISFFPLLDFGAGFINPYQEFGPPFGSSMDAEVTVRDNISYLSHRIEGTDTTTTNRVLALERYGYFMKLGDDGQRFSGWILRGFSGGVPQNNTIVDLFHENGNLFTGNTSTYENYSSLIIRQSVDQTADTLITDTLVYTTSKGYVLLNGDNLLVERVGDGEVLRAEVREPGNGVFFTVTAETDSGFTVDSFEKNAEQKFEVTIATPNNHVGSWNFIYFQEFIRHSQDTSSTPLFQSLSRKRWAVPYWVE